jgi:hypothetical protein
MMRHKLHPVSLQSVVLVWVASPIRRIVGILPEVDSRLHSMDQFISSYTNQSHWFEHMEHIDTFDWVIITHESL